MYSVYFAMLCNNSRRGLKFPFFSCCQFLSWYYIRSLPSLCHPPDGKLGLSTLNTGQFFLIEFQFWPDWNRNQHFFFQKLEWYQEFRSAFFCIMFSSSASQSSRPNLFFFTLDLSGVGNQRSEEISMTCTISYEVIESLLIYRHIGKA